MNIKELAEQAGMYCDDDAFFSKRYFNEQDVNIEDLKRFAELVAAAEREACAKLCDDEARQSGSDHEAGGMYWCAEKIRAMGKPQRPVKSYTNGEPQYATEDMSTKSQNVYTSEERVHEIDKSIHDLRVAAEMALQALCSANPIGHALEDYEYHNKATEALRQALAQPEQGCAECGVKASDGYALYCVKCTELFTQPEQEPWDTSDMAYRPNGLSVEQKKEPTPSNVDPRVLLISDSDFTTEAGNRLCDIERRLAVIETQPDETTSKKPHAVSYKDGVPVAHYNFDPPPYTAPPSKPWVSLTDEEIDEAIESCKTTDTYKYFRAIEAALRSKNT